MKQRLVFALACILLTVSSGVTVASASAKSPVSVRFTLRATEAKAGVPIKGTVTITNATSTTLMVESCATDGWLWVGLTNKTTPFSPVVASVACGATIKLRPGANRFPVTVMTVQQVWAGCRKPHCKNPGPPPLPKGTYHTDVVTLGLPKGSPTLTHLRVTLT